MYVTVNAELQCDAMYVIEETSGSPSHVRIETAYIPLVAKESLWGKTFLVATTYSGAFECVSGSSSFRGIMRPYGLPGMVRDVYIDDDVLTPDDEYMTIEYNARPDSQDGTIQAFLFLAVISLAIFLFIHIRKKPFA